MRFLREVRPLACIVGALLIAGCGGSTASIGGDDSGAGPGPACGGDAPVVVPCPPDVPVAETACTTDFRLTCEYGAQLDARCDVLAHCQGGAWSLTGPSPSAICPSPANSAACPGALDLVPRGGPCQATDDECTYPDGRCVCVPLPSAPSSAAWVCDDPAPGCPQPRPRLGSACDEGQYAECGYGELGQCEMPGGVMLECDSGYWTIGNPICP